MDTVVRVCLVFPSSESHGTCHIYPPNSDTATRRRTLRCAVVVNILPANDAAAAMISRNATPTAGMTMSGTLRGRFAEGRISAILGALAGARGGPYALFEVRDG